VLGVDRSATSESLEHIAAMRAPPVRSAAAKSRILSNRRSGASCELAGLVYRHPFTLDLCAAGAHCRHLLPLTFLRMH
jgi:hypothetical protein